MPNAHYALGCCTVAGMFMAFQSYHGLVGYLEYVASNWVEIPGGFWIGLAAAVMSMLASAALERREQRAKHFMLEHIRNLNLKAYGTRGWGDDNDKPGWTVSTRWKHCGLLSVTYGCARYEYNLHLGVCRSHWTWGYKRDWYDGPLPMVGAGPLVLICWR